MTYQLRFLKKNNFVAPVISELINQKFYEGKYPTRLKLGKVILIYKIGSKTLPGK